MMDVTNQIMKMIASVTEKDVPMAVSILFRNEPSMQLQPTLFSSPNQASLRYLGCRYAGMLLYVVQLQSCHTPSMSIEGQRSATYADIVSIFGSGGNDIDFS
jgi:hypothetical protein